MKKSIFAFLLGFIMMFGCVYAENIPDIPVETTEDIKIISELPVEKLIKGDSVYLDVELNNISEIYAFEIILEYDTDFLKYKKVDIFDMNDEDIITEKEEDGRLMIVYSKMGQRDVKSGKKICTFEFSSLKSGNTSVGLESAKIVFSDMTYYKNVDIDNITDIKIRSNTSQSGGGGGSSGRGSGSRGNSSSGMTISGGGVTSSAVKVPDDPVIIEKNEYDEETEVFCDVIEEHWACEVSIELSKKNIINGFEDKTFKPEQGITRAEFAKILMFEEEFNDNFSAIFSDVKSNEWYYNVVNTAASIGLIRGNGDGMFFPENAITREEAAVIMYRYAEYKNAPLLPLRININFKDELNISDFAVGSIDALYVSGILNGTDEGYFYPDSNITRAEAASAVYNLLNVVKKEK